MRAPLRQQLVFGPSLLVLGPAAVLISAWWITQNSLFAVVLSTALVAGWSTAWSP